MAHRGSRRQIRAVNDFARLFSWDVKVDAKAGADPARAGKPKAFREKSGGTKAVKNDREQDVQIENGKWRSRDRTAPWQSLSGAFVCKQLRQQTLARLAPCPVT